MRLEREGITQTRKLSIYIYTFTPCHRNPNVYNRNYKTMWFW